MRHERTRGLPAWTASANSRNNNHSQEERTMRRSLSKNTWIAVMVDASCGAAAAMAHEGHKQSQGKPATPPATTTSAATTKLPVAAVKKVDLVGELVDPQCWFTHNADGKDHAKCALNCAKGGQDLAFF